MAAGRRKPDTRAVGDTALVTTTGSTASAGQAAIIIPSRLPIVGDGDDGSSVVGPRAAATQPPSQSKVHALQRLTNGVRRAARTRSSELAGGFTLQGSQKSVGPHL